MNIFGALVHDTGIGKLKHYTRSMFQCHFVCHISHMDWPGFKPSAVGGL